MNDPSTELTWGAQLKWGVERLQGTVTTTPKLDASVLLAHVLDVPRTLLIGFPEREISDADAARYSALISRRVDGEPVAYLTGHKEFMGIDLMVDARVLVPRPETELVVEAALRVLEERLGEPPDNANDTLDAPVPELLVADIGTGSGAIAIALAVLEPRIKQIYATDISPDALIVARHNGDRHHVTDRVNWLEGDLLESLEIPVDLIIANLPYVADNPDDIMPEVRRYEPHIALFGADGGLGHIERLIAQIPSHLRSGGAVVLEFGYNQHASLAAALAAAFPQARITFGKDYAGWDRYVVIQC
jgi:release factor glutamine methyltransferase